MATEVGRIDFMFLGSPTWPLDPLLYDVTQRGARNRMPRNKPGFKGLFQYMLRQWLGHTSTLEIKEKGNKKPKENNLY